VTVGEPCWHVEQADALDAALRAPAGSFSLIYADPPFFTGRAHRERGGGSVAFDDRWRGNMDAYTSHIAGRIAAMRRLLHDRGSLLLHLDWRAAAHLRLACDAIFGSDRLMNEIIWSYNSGGGSARRYGRKHDTILWYAAGPAPVFNADAARVPYDAKIARSRAHLFHPAGKVSGDVLDIPRPPNHAKEWTGWPTQKPLALLEWFVRVHTRPGDLVGDFFCGSGTTLVAAVRLGRRAFGSDISPEAVALARTRLSASSPANPMPQNTPPDDAEPSV